MARCTRGALSPLLPLLLALALRAPACAGFSTFAGSCKHAGVNHGLDKFAAQECGARAVVLLPARTRR